MHLRTIDPFADRFKEADTREIAQAIQVTQRTVQRALCSLSTKELIDLEFTGFKFRLRSKLTTPVSQSDQNVATSTSPKDTHVATCTSRHDAEIATHDIHVVQTTPMSPERHTGRDRLLETFQGNGSRASHTIQTNKTNQTLLKERERDAHERDPEPVENSKRGNPRIEPDYAPQPIALINGSDPKTQGAAPPPSPVKLENFNWTTYAKPGDGGSEPEYFAWAIAQVTRYSDDKLARGEPPIGDIPSYTVTYIRNRGASGYQKYLESKHPIAPTPSTPNGTSRLPDLKWSTPVDVTLPIYDDLSDFIAIIKTHLALRKWGWSLPQLQLWVCSAQDDARRYAWPPIDFQPALGYSNWPDWAIAKLAQDLEAHA